MKQCHETEKRSVEPTKTVIATATDGVHLEDSVQKQVKHQRPQNKRPDRANSWTHAP